MQKIYKTYNILYEQNKKHTHTHIESSSKLLIIYKKNKLLVLHIVPLGGVIAVNFYYGVIFFLFFLLAVWCVCTILNALFSRIYKNVCSYIISLTSFYILLGFFFLHSHVPVFSNVLRLNCRETTNIQNNKNNNNNIPT